MLQTNTTGGMPLLNIRRLVFQDGDGNRTGSIAVSAVYLSSNMALILFQDSSLAFLFSALASGSSPRRM